MTAQVPEAVSAKKRSRECQGVCTVRRPVRSKHGGQKHHSTVARWRVTTFMYCATPIHTTLHANNLPAVRSKCRRNSGTAVESSPQKTSAPAQVLCDRLRPSKNCRLKSLSDDSTDHQQVFHGVLAFTQKRVETRLPCANALHKPYILPVSPFVVAKFPAPPGNANEIPLPCRTIAQVAQQAPA